MMIFFIPLQFQELFAKHLDAGSPLEPPTTKCILGNQCMAEIRNSGMVIMCGDWVIRSVTVYVRVYI